MNPQHIEYTQWLYSTNISTLIDSEISHLFDIIDCDEFDSHNFKKIYRQIRELRSTNEFLYFDIIGSIIERIKAIRNGIGFKSMNEIEPYLEYIDGYDYKAIFPTYLICSLLIDMQLN